MLYFFTIDYSADKFVDDILNLKEPTIFLGTQGIKHDEYKELCKSTIPQYFYQNERVNLYVSDYPTNLMFPDISVYPLMDFGSIAHEAIHFALYTHPDKIYLVGCDCSNAGYFDGAKQRFSANYMVTGWEQIKQFKDQYYPDVEVISVNPVGLKGLFEDSFTQEYMESLKK